ncbi:Exopolygalacturonase [Thalictrum thalictroides]|uniref:Exopolygalacturonase n=1 Tax=Thalictrum thalictroides TaxID=46969 RepID=A0A7J6W8Q5_THATH|nr:Exopolygalacturonase [Thalictrum thalictroides]
MSVQAFWTAWTDACAWNGGGTVLIPKGNYLVGPTTFKGPCKGPIDFQIQGVVNAPTDLSKFKDYADGWIRFQYVNGLFVGGGGTFHGHGSSAWSHNDCNKNKNCRFLPISLRFDFINYGTVEGINSVDSKSFHMNIFNCNNMKFNYLTIMAPEDSPNTDGIHIGESRSISISHSKIGTGDDCISFGAGSKNIYVSNVTCGPGHGISVGSLGKIPKEGNVVGLVVKNCTFIGTSNGVRIKTWGTSNTNFVSNITFEDIFMNNVYNPIFIDQEYCPLPSCDDKTPSKVLIKDVHYRNIWGTSSSKVAVNFVCSRSLPCQKIEVKDIYLPYNGNDGQASANCLNVRGYTVGKLLPKLSINS